MRINHNISSMITASSLSAGNRQVGLSLEKLSTGLRINSASDDAAGLSVSEQLRTQVRGMNRAKSNAQDGIALLQIAEGAANEVSAILQRMRELAVQSSNDTLTSNERSYLQLEFSSLKAEVDRIAQATSYNGQTLLDGRSTSFGAAGGASSVLHIGANARTNTDTMTIAMNALKANDLGLHSAAGQVLNPNDTAYSGIYDTTSGRLNSQVIDGVIWGWEAGSGHDFVITVSGGVAVMSGFYSNGTSNLVDGSASFPPNGTVLTNFQLRDGSQADITAQVAQNPSLMSNVQYLYADNFPAGQVTTGGGEYTAGLNISNNTNAMSAIRGLDDSIQSVNSARSTLGAYINRLEHAINNLSNQGYNTQDAESRIRDVDFASETTAFTKNQILTQSSTSMLSQANQVPQGVLKLLG